MTNTAYLWCNIVFISFQYGQIHKKFTEYKQSIQNDQTDHSNLKKHLSHKWSDSYIYMTELYLNLRTVSYVQDLT